MVQMTGKFSLDVASPAGVPLVLREAAEVYRESAVELESCWQDKEAGRPWAVIADELERAVKRMEKRLPFYVKPDGAVRVTRIKL